MLGSLVYADEEVKARRMVELDALYGEISRSVSEGDFEAYAATCHENAVLVSGIRKDCYPLAKALKRWEQEFIDTREGRRKSKVTFRFSERLGDEVTAHETGIFLYEFQMGDEPLKQEYVHLETLLLKTADGWKIMLEYQKGVATKEEWDALK
jgi:ketosteroid isomerase-like protein